MNTSSSIAGFDPIAGLSSGLSINSLSFALLAFAGVLGCRLVPRVSIRQFVLLLLNAYFLHYFIRTVYEVAVLAAFLTVVYAFGVGKQVFGKVRAVPAIAAAVVVLWVFLFLIKDPGLVAPVNPFAYFPVKLIGISYIVFRGISYIMEVERERENSFIGFLNYMLFFPTLLAGPIERYTHFQSSSTQPPLDWQSTLYPALNRILNGLIKKFVLADNLMAFGIFALSQEGEFSLMMMWIGALAMLFLIYLDFSGYCDIVIGLAALMGFRIAENFNRPFAARNVQEFWTRWHMSLSSLIHDFVFTPLSKVIITRAPRRTQFILITGVYLFSMILVAMWHGTTVGFLIFGCFHASLLVLIQLKKQYGKRFFPKLYLRRAPGPMDKVTSLLACAATYSFISVSLIWWYQTLPAALKTFTLLLGM